MTRDRIINRMAEIDEIIIVEKGREERNSKGAGALHQENIQTMINLIKPNFCGYDITADFTRNWIDNNSNSTTAIQFMFNIEGRNTSWSSNVRLTIDEDFGITNYRTDGDNHDMRKGKEAEFTAKLNEQIAAAKLVTKVFEYFNDSVIGIVQTAIKELPEYQFENGENISLLQQEKRQLEHELKRIDLNLNNGTIVEYNDTWWRGGYEYDNWIKVKIVKTSANQVTMIRIWENNGVETDGATFRKKYFLHRFRTTDEGITARAEEQRIREEREAARNARFNVA